VKGDYATLQVTCQIFWIITNKRRSKPLNISWTIEMEGDT